MIYARINKVCIAFAFTTQNLIAHTVLPYTLLLEIQPIDSMRIYAGESIFSS